MAQRRRRSPVCVLGAAGAAFALTLGACSSSKPAVNRTSSTTRAPSQTTAAAPKTTVPAVLALHEVQIAELSHPVEDVSSGPVTGGVLALAGIDASGSTNRAFIVSGSAIHNVTAFPVRQHDAAAASIGGALYVFGGGDGTNQLDAIWRVDANGNATRVSTLPAASSDSAATTVGDTAYVVGGYDGQKWLDTVVAYRPGSAPRVVAHLPQPLRYAAVASDGTAVYVFGGSTQSADASSDVLRVDVTTGRVTRVAQLPSPISHAAAANLDGHMILAGGHGTSSSALSSSILALDTKTNTLRAVGQLSVARSDLSLATDGSRVIAIGGRAASGRTGIVGAIEVVPTATPASFDGNVYSHTGVGDMSAAVRGERSLVYVPNSMSNTVDVIDPTTMRVIDHFAVGTLPQHVTPSWDMRTLYVDNDRGNSLTPIDPRTGRRSGPDIPVDDPYNLYFTPDGHSAIVVAERLHRLDFRDPHTMALQQSVTAPCSGVDHLDFTADGTHALASCEFSGQMLVLDIVHRSVVSVLTLHAGSRPQDVKLSPDGRTFYVADMNSNGVWLVNASTFTVERLMPTGNGAHGLYPSRDARLLYVTNRGDGSISVIDFATQQIVARWSIPGGSPDMGGVSADGKVLWLSGRYNGEVYALSTVDGHLIARIRVGSGPHGLCVWPQPGRYSIGHTGNTR